MATKKDLAEWVYDALVSNGGEAKIVDVAKPLWSNHKDDLRDSADLFFTWQYDMRWAAQHLRDTGMCVPTATSQRGGWKLKK